MSSGTSKVGVPLKRAVLEQVMPVVPSVVGDSDINDKLLHFIDKNIPIESEKEQKVGPHLFMYSFTCMPLSNCAMRRSMARLI